MQKVLVPVDGSLSAERAIDYVIATKSDGPRQVHLLNVQPLPMPNSVIVFPKVRMMVDAHHRAGKRILHPSRVLLKEHGIDHIAEVLLGDVGYSIVHYAEERGCTSIVIGTRGMSALGNLLLQSVAAAVIHRTTLPVTLVKATANAVLGIRSDDRLKRDRRRYAAAVA